MALTEADDVSTPRIPSAPEERFACDWKGYDVLPSLCVQLQSVDREHASERNQYCASGECKQGKTVREVLERLAALPKPAPVLKAKPAPSRPPMLSVSYVEITPLGHLEPKAAPRTPAPAEPEPTLESIMEEKTCKRGCGRKLGPNNKSGVCTTCQQGAVEAVKKAPAVRKRPVQLLARQPITEELAAELSFEELEVCFRALVSRLDHVDQVRARVEAFVMDRSKAPPVEVEPTEPAI